MAEEQAELFPGQKELQEKIERVKRAQRIYANYPQEKVDAILLQLPLPKHLDSNSAIN